MSQVWLKMVSQQSKSIVPTSWQIHQLIVHEEVQDMAQNQEVFLQVKESQDILWVINQIWTSYWIRRKILEIMKARRTLFLNQDIQ